MQKKKKTIPGDILMHIQTGQLSSLPTVTAIHSQHPGHRLDVVLRRTESSPTLSGGHSYYHHQFTGEETGGEGRWSALLRPVAA